MTKYLIVIAFLLGFGFYLRGQGNILYDVNVIRPSPNAMSIVDRIMHPVDLYTGTPKISIPLCALQGQSFTIPISLDYDASGTNASEVSGPVGLGWSLNAGGLITRIVRNKPDDGINGFLG